MNIKVIGQSIPNLPWQDRKPGSNEIIWRYTENPIISWNPFKAAARVYNSAVVSVDGKFKGVDRKSVV